jgi:hypothetical protein
MTQNARVISGSFFIHPDARNSAASGPVVGGQTTAKSTSRRGRADVDDVVSLVRVP